MAIKKASELETPTPDIEAMRPYWQKVDDIVEGYEAIKARGEVYLPKFPEETIKDYKTRLGLTKFTNVYRDVLEGLATKPFEEEVRLTTSDKNTEPPKEMLEFVENVDGSSNNITVFASQLFFNGINNAIDWILIDYPKTEGTAMRTLADQKAAGFRPYWTHVLARNVIVVKSKIIKGEEVLSYIRFYEYEEGEQEKIRIFERQEDGKITWELWEKQPLPAAAREEATYAMIDSGDISIDVIPMVPFITGRRIGKSFKFYPVMRDAADLQIDLYQDESGLKFIKTMSAYPMLAANGVSPEKDAAGKPLKMAVGPMKILYSKADGAGNYGEFKYIEPTANSLEFLKKSIDQTKLDLRELGRQPLTAQSSQLTVVTTAVAAGKARSAVSTWALLLKDALENALVITAKWMQMKGYDPEVTVFTEFDDLSEGATDLEALSGARERGDISRETYWHELGRRKVLSPDFNAKEEERRLLNEIPSDNGLDTDPNDQTGDSGQ